MNIQLQNFLEQQLILKEIELQAHHNLSEFHDNGCVSIWDEKDEAIVSEEIKILEEKIDELKKENFPEDAH